jgi:hypothetical protein
VCILNKQVLGKIHQFPLKKYETPIQILPTQSIFSHGSFGWRLTRGKIRIRSLEGI